MRTRIPGLQNRVRNLISIVHRKRTSVYEHDNHRLACLLHLLKQQVLPARKFERGTALILAAGPRSASEYEHRHI